MEAGYDVYVFTNLNQREDLGVDTRASLFIAAPDVTAAVYCQHIGGQIIKKTKTFMLN